VQDPAITRFRPTIVHAEAHDILDLQSRATLERNVRAGKGERITVLVNEWTTVEGTVWRPNTLARFKNPILGIDATVLIATVRLRFSASSPREAELELTRPEAFSNANYPVIKRGATWK
jgi:prophage tail gpP-like protein